MAIVTLAQGWWIGMHSRGRSVTCGTSSKWTSLLSSALSWPSMTFPLLGFWQFWGAGPPKFLLPPHRLCTRWHYPRKLVLEGNDQQNWTKLVLGMTFWIRCEGTQDMVCFMASLDPLKPLWKRPMRGWLRRVTQRSLTLLSPLNWIGCSTRLGQFTKTSAKLNPSGGWYGETSYLEARVNILC